MQENAYANVGRVGQVAIVKIRIKSLAQVLPGVWLLTWRGPLGLAMLSLGLWVGLGLAVVRPSLLSPSIPYPPPPPSQPSPPTTSRLGLSLPNSHPLTPTLVYLYLVTSMHWLKPTKEVGTGQVGKR